MKLYSSLETPSISPKETLERELNRKSIRERNSTDFGENRAKMVQNQHQETPEFKAIQQNGKLAATYTTQYPKHLNFQVFKP